MSLENLRRQYTTAGLNESEFDPNPIAQFREWFDELLANVPVSWFEPNAMTLATASSSGDVTARVVLLKGVDEDGFTFFTNYESTKGQQLAENPQAALVMHWPFLERQVRVQGDVTKVPRKQSERYFHARPRQSQISAAISAQSSQIKSREALEALFQQFESELGDGPVPLPENWGGYCLAPSHIEFWQGRENRLHDRILYSKVDENWLISRLCP